MVNKPVIIWGVVCPHIGAKYCNLSLFEKHIKEAVKNKWRVILLGDIINNGVSAGSAHVGLEFQDAMDPMAQCELAIDTLMPLAKAKLIEFVVGGNHSYRTQRAVGIHPESFITMMLSIATDGRKPTAILPAVVQKVHELKMRAETNMGGGRQFREYNRAKEELIQIISGIPAGTKPNWAIPFYPGIGQRKIEGVPVVAHHGSHSKSKDNWKMLENSSRGFRLYFTGHNHRMGWEPGLEDIGGKMHDQDFFSCGTYQDSREEYAQVACYSPVPCGSLVVEYDPSTDKAKFFKLD